MPVEAQVALVDSATIACGRALLELLRTAHRRWNAHELCCTVCVGLAATEPAAALVTGLAGVAILLARIERPEAAHVAGG